MTTPVPQIPPARADVVENDGDGRMLFTRAWYRYLSLFQQQTMAGQDAIEADPQPSSAVAYLDPTLSAAVADLDVARTQMSETRESVFGLQKMMSDLDVARMQLGETRELVFELQKQINDIRQGTVL